MQNQEQIIHTMQLEEYGANFVEDAMEFAMLDDDARTAFNARHAQIVRSVPSYGQSLRGGRGGGFQRGGGCELLAQFLFIILRYNFLNSIQLVLSGVMLMVMTGE